MDSGVVDSGSPVDASALPTVDYSVSLDDTTSERPVSRALPGHYNLSGAMFRNDQVPELTPKPRAVKMLGALVVEHLAGRADLLDYLRAVIREESVEQPAGRHLIVPAG